MNIVNATSDHVEYISRLLAQYFSDANHFFEYPKYKDDYDLMHKHVSKRIEVGEEGFVYFVAEDEGGKPLGFTNLLIDEHGVGSILVTIGDSKEVLKELTVKALEYFKENNVTNVQVESFAYENDVKSIYAEMGASEELSTLKLSI